MKNKNNNQNEFERLGGQKSGGGGDISPLSPPLDPPLLVGYLRMHVTGGRTFQKVVRRNDVIITINV